MTEYVGPVGGDRRYCGYFAPRTCRATATMGSVGSCTTARSRDAHPPQRRPAHRRARSRSERAGPRPSRSSCRAGRCALRRGARTRLPARRLFRFPALATLLVLGLLLVLRRSFFLERPAGLLGLACGLRLRCHDDSVRRSPAPGRSRRRRAIIPTTMSEARETITPAGSGAPAQKRGARPLTINGEAPLSGERPVAR